MSPRNHLGALALASGLQAASGNSADQDNQAAAGVSVVIDITAVAGTSPTLTCKLQAKDPISGKYVDIPGAVTTALAAPGTTMLTVRPGVTVVANAQIAAPLPRLWRLVWTLGGTGGPSVTFTATGLYLL